MPTATEADVMSVANKLIELAAAATSPQDSTALGAQAIITVLGPILAELQAIRASLAK